MYLASPSSFHFLLIHVLHALLAPPPPPPSFPPHFFLRLATLIEPDELARWNGIAQSAITIAQGIFTAGQTHKQPTAVPLYFKNIFIDLYTLIHRFY